MISHVVIMSSIFLVLGLAVGFLVGCIFGMVAVLTDRSRRIKKQREEGMGWVDREGKLWVDINREG